MFFVVVKDVGFSDDFRFEKGGLPVSFKKNAGFLVHSKVLAIDTY